MGFLVTIYNTVVYEPLFNALILLYQYIPGKDFGIAIIVFTLLVRLALYRVSAQGIVAQKKMAALQPKIKELQKKFKDKKQEQSKAIFELYRQEKINPFAGLLPLLMQLPIFIALFQLFGRGFGPEQMQALYFFVPNPGLIDLSLFGLLDLSERAFAVAVLAGIFQFIQSKQMISPKKKAKSEKGRPDFSSMMQTQMVYFFPFFTVLIVSQLPSAFGIYWIFTSLFSIGQYWYIKKKDGRKKPELQTHSNEQNTKPQPA